MARLFRKIPAPSPEEMMEVVKTNRRTSGGLVEVPKIKLTITAINVVAPISISVMPKRIISPPCFIL